MNASYDILQAIKSKPPIVEEPKPRTRRASTKADAAVMQLIKKLSTEDLAKLMKM